jgi:hypothetical protein
MLDKPKIEIVANELAMLNTQFFLQLSVLKNMWSQFSIDCAEYALIAIVFYWCELCLDE